MTDAQITKFSALIEAFENGLAGENEFIEVAMDWNVPAAAINEVLASIRLEDGVDNVGC